MTQKEGFQCFYLAVILIDSIYRKYETHYPKVFLKYPDDCDEQKISNLISSHPEMQENFFREIKEILVFQALQVPS